MTTRTLWLAWKRLAGKSNTEQCRAFREEASVTTGHVWSEHFDVDIKVEIREPRKPRQKRSTLDVRPFKTFALDAVIGPIVASPARVQAVHVKKFWATDTPGVMVIIRTHRPAGPESENP